MPKRSSMQDIDLQASEVLAAVAEEAVRQPLKNPAAVALGRMGGLKGGRARAYALTAEQRVEIAKKGALARWGVKEEGE